MSQYTFTTKIGEGGFSIVFNAIHTTTNTPVIIKKIINGASNHRINKMAENEIKKLQILNHPQIPKILNYFQLETFMCVVFENHGTTTLRNKMDFYYNKDIYTISSLRSLNDIIILFTQLVDILAYIHSVNIVHNDLKPENIIWGYDNKIYLIDFGSAAFSNITGSTKRSRTISYAGSAPELIKNVKISKENECFIDIWSLGVIMMDVIIGFIVLDGTDESESIEEMLINNIWDFNIMLGNYFSEYPKLMELWDSVPDELKMIISKCLSLNPTKRPKMNELLLDDKFTKLLNTKTSVVQNFKNPQQTDFITKMQLKIDKLEKIIADRPKTFKMVNKLTSHTNIINTIIYSPCGNYIASGSQDTTIRIWTVSNNKLFQLLDEQHNPISCLSYSPSGTFLVCGTSNGVEDTKIIIREKMANNYFRIIQTLNLQNSKINSIAYSPCGNYIAFVVIQILTSKNYLHIIKRSGDFTFNKFQILELIDYESKHLTYSPCGDYILLENAIFKKSVNGHFNLFGMTNVENQNINKDIEKLLETEFIKNIIPKIPPCWNKISGIPILNIYYGAICDTEIIKFKNNNENIKNKIKLINSLNLFDLFYHDLNIIKNIQFKEIIENIHRHVKNIQEMRENNRLINFRNNHNMSMCEGENFGNYETIEEVRGSFDHLYKKNDVYKNYTDDGLFFNFFDDINNISDVIFKMIIKEYLKYYKQLNNIIKKIENPPESTLPIIAKFSPCGNYTVSIVNGGLNIDIKEKNGDEFNLIQSIVNDDKNKINYLSYSPCGNYFITTTISSIKVYKKMYDNTFDIVQSLVGHNNNCVCYSHCGNYFIVGSTDNTIRIYTSVL
jgi:serine/threonine protein kinase